MLLRICIEAVKQNLYTIEAHDAFVKLINRCDACILGCTELPVLYEKYREDIKCKIVYDPLYLSIMKLRRDFDNE